MKADPFQIGDVLKDARRFIVPIYQRTYAWTKERQLDRFFDAIEAKARERLAGKASSFPHYMGAILLSPRGKFTFGEIPVFDIVDGQQRLSTYQLFLAALRDLAKTIGAPELAAQIAPFLLNTETPLMKMPEQDRYKLQATDFDKALFEDLVNLDRDALRKKHAIHFYKNGNILPSRPPKPLSAWWFFREESAAFVEENGADKVTRLKALLSGMLEDFRVIVITLDDTDDAQVIFETLNTGGEPLNAMDLVRNDVFHRAIRRNEDVHALLKERWSKFEDPFWKQDSVQGRIRKPRIDFFLAHTLTAETGKEVPLGELYARYKAFVTSRNFSTVDAELACLVRHAPTYVTLSNPGGSDELSALARQLTVFDVSTAYPLVFVIAAAEVEDEDRTWLYRRVASYIVRRALCGLTPKNYNNTFVRLAGYLRDNGVSRQSFAAGFADSTGDTVRFPSDDEFRNAIQTRIQYGSLPTPRLAYVLGELERASRDKYDETVGLRNDLTIEHVLPDKWAEHWPLPDGSRAPMDYVVTADDPRRAAITNRQVMKHTLGNLTLLTPAGNPRLGNLPFTTTDTVVGMSKREALRTSLLKMNQEIAAREVWNEVSIAERALLLADRAIARWPSIL